MMSATVQQHRSPERRRVVLVVFAVAFLVYAATATYSYPWHIDTTTNAVTARALAVTGSPLLPEYEEATRPGQYGNVGWIVMSPRGPVSQYPPGAALFAAPLYLPVRSPLEPKVIRGFNNPDLPAVSFPMPSLVPAALAAVLATAAAVALVAGSIHRLGATRREAMVSGAVLAFGTGLWSGAADELWQHGPASALVAAGTYLCLSGRRFAAGAVWGVSILVRPHLAVIPAIVGVGLAVRERSLRPALSTGVASFPGLAALLAYNWWVWGELTIVGGYSDDFADNFVNGGVVWFLRNILGALIDIDRGLLLYTPMLVLLILGLAAGWKRADAPTRLAAVGGLVYLLVQLRANRFSGGDGHTGYRYPIEAIVAAAPLFFESYRAWISQRPRVKRLFVGSVVLSVVPQLIWAITT
jgi:hypothetical protein